MEEQLDALVQKENALHCFDSKSLTTAQIKKVSSELVLDGIKKKGQIFLLLLTNRMHLCISISLKLGMHLESLRYFLLIANLTSPKKQNSIRK